MEQGHGQEGGKDARQHKTMQERAFSLPHPQGGEGFYFVLASNEEMQEKKNTKNNKEKCGETLMTE